MSSSNNYELQLEKWADDFRANGREIITQHNKYPVINGHMLNLAYFHGSYILDLDTGKILNKDGTPSHLDTMSQMMIYSHLTCLKKDAAPSGSMVTLQGIPEAAVFNDAFRRTTGKELVDSVKDDLNGFTQKLMSYGAIIEPFGDLGVSFYAFSDLKISYILWIGDEEFDSDIRVLFDSNIVDFVHPESVVILGLHGFTLMEEIAGMPKPN